MKKLFSILVALMAIVLLAFFIQTGLSEPDIQQHSETITLNIDSSAKPQDASSSSQEAK